MNPFILQPLLQGEKIFLRPLTQEDFEELYQSASDPLIWELHPQPTRYQREVFKGFFEVALNSGGGFAVVDLETEKIIGSSRYYDYNPADSSIVVGYTFLERKYWGGSYNREMKKLLLDHAFQFVDTVIFEIGATNWRSRRAIEKIGAVLAGEAKLDEKTHVIYKINKEQWRTHVPESLRI